MTSDLVEKLKRASPRRRREAAMELAATHTRAAVKELINMVEGGKRRAGRHYTYQDRLIGIDALGETRSITVLDYLTSLISEYEVGEPMQEGVVYGDDESSLLQIHCKVAFPKAKGKLGEELYLVYKKRIFCKGEASKDDLEQLAADTRKLVEPEESRINLFPAPYLTVSEAYQKIQAAIKKLEAACQNALATKLGT